MVITGCGRTVWHGCKFAGTIKIPPLFFFFFHLGQIRIHAARWIYFVDQLCFRCITFKQPQEIRCVCCCLKGCSDFNKLLTLLSPFSTSECLCYVSRAKVCYSSAALQSVAPHPVFPSEKQQVRWPQLISVGLDGCITLWGRWYVAKAEVKTFLGGSANAFC